MFFFFPRRRGHTRFKCDWSSDVCSSDLRGSDHGDDRLHVKFTAERPVGCKGSENRRRIGKPAGLYHDTAEMRDDAALAVRDQAAQRYRKIGTDIAAEAAVAEDRNTVARPAQQR